jgi:hypothetical protein
MPNETFIEVERIFEQPTDSVSFYSDIAQVFKTESEIVLQFYETIPGAPSTDGKIKKVRTRLRTTVTLSLQHAKNLATLLLTKATQEQK